MREAGKSSEMPGINPWIVVFGFAFFFAWQNASFSFLFPSSADRTVSPLCVGDLSACFLLVLCLVSYKRDRAAFSPAWLLGLGLIAAAGACTAIVLLSRSLLPLWGIYLAAAVVGFATAATAYLWATVLARMDVSEALWCAICGMLGGLVIDFLLMNGLEMGIPIFVTLCAVGSLGCFALTTRGSSLDESPVLVRPKHPREFAKLALGIALFAVALGIVAGTTAEQCTEDSMRTINYQETLVGIVVTFLVVAAVAAGRRRLQTLSLLRAFSAGLLAVILLNIVWLDLASLWLTLTLFAWQMLKVLALLAVVGIERRRIVSLSVVFPAAWAALKTGHGIGVFVGQTLIPLGGAELQSLMNSIVLVAFLVAVAAILLLSNRMVLDATSVEATGANPAAVAKSASPDDSDTPTGPRAVTASPDTQAPSPKSTATLDATERPLAQDPENALPLPLEKRCEQIAARYRLSAREGEVFLLLAQGHTRPSIAKRLFVSENTVREHGKSIYKKLHIHSKQQLIDMVDRSR